MKKVYLEVEPGQIVYLVFSSKREGYNGDIVIKCKVDKAVIYENSVTYSCEPIKIVTKDKEDIGKYVTAFVFRPANINTGYGSGFGGYPVFTEKETCIKWLKEKKMGIIRKDS